MGYKCQTSFRIKKRLQKSRIEVFVPIILKLNALMYNIYLYPFVKNHRIISKMTIQFTHEKKPSNIFFINILACRKYLCHEKKLRRLCHNFVSCFVFSHFLLIV